MHQHVEPLQPNVPEKNIDYNDRINQQDIDCGKTTVSKQS